MTRTLAVVLAVAPTASRLLTTASQKTTEVPADPATSKPTDNEPATPPLTAYAVAAAGVRDVAKWSLVTLGAVAAVVFGGSPLVTRPDFDLEDNLLRIGLAAAAGAIGLLCLVGLVLTVSRLLTPARITLETLPPEMLKALCGAHERYFPGDTKTLPEFQERYRTLALAAANLRADVAAGAFQRTLAPPGTQPAEGALHEYRKYALAAVDSNLARFKDAATAILDEAQFAKTEALAKERRRPIFLLASGAALGALAFQLILTQSTDETPAASSKVGHLPAETPTTSDRTPQQELLDKLGVSGCIVPQVGIPLLVTGGNGSDDDPYTVATISQSDNCPAVSFNLRESAFGTLDFPEAKKIKITYSPSKGD